MENQLQLENQREQKGILFDCFCFFAYVFINDSKTEHYRTPEINSVIGGVAQLSKGLGEIKKSDSQNLFEKSDLVPPTTHNLNDILEGTREFARVWDLYGYLIKEA